MIQIKNLNFGYTKDKVLKNIDLNCSKGEVVSLLGPNGSGKSTLIKILAGVLKNSNYDLFKIKGRDIDSYNRKEIAKIVSYLPQFQEQIKGITVKEIVSLGRTPYKKNNWYLSKEDKDKVNWAMDYMKISQYANENIETLSGGQKQRVWIGMTLAQDTEIILLDEPVTYMDLKHQWELLKIINDLKEVCKKTVISVFHDINHALEVSDTTFLLKEGKVYSKGNTQFVINEKSIREVYDLNTKVCRVKGCCRNVLVPEEIKKIKGVI